MPTITVAPPANGPTQALNGVVLIQDQCQCENYFSTSPGFCAEIDFTTETLVVGEDPSNLCPSGGYSFYLMYELPCYSVLIIDGSIQASVLTWCAPIWNFCVIPKNTYALSQ